MKSTCTWLVCLFTSISLLNGQTVEDLQSASVAFRTSLTEDQVAAIQFHFTDTQRVKWTNLPVGLAPRPGLQYGTLSEESKILLHRLLTTLLSSQGYLKITSIMRLDDILNQVYDEAIKRNLVPASEIEAIQGLNWGFDNYYLAFWGDPTTETVWGFKLEGHHISVNLSVVGDFYSVTPLFLGTDPAEVEITTYAGLRVLSKEEDYGFDLIHSLTAEQQAMATISMDTPQDIITNPDAPQRLTTYQGIKGSELTPVQRALLEDLIGEYVHNLEHMKAHFYLDLLQKSGVDNIYFAWVGSYEVQKPHYYVIHSPDFIIEFDNVGFQNNANHIHSIWREKGNDFGEDLLRKHYAEHKH
ncbi:MAG: DUF3500 domain-containing protein [Lewinellaceae bacterium]|nr:DUF3500 domain-containing protein [Lewinellaceae bacterium]